MSNEEARVIHDGSAEKVAEFIYERRMYSDEHERVVEERHPVHGVPPDGFVQFRSFGVLRAKTRYGPVRHRYEIPIPGAQTPKQAFDGIAAAAPGAQAKGEEEMRKGIAEQVEQMRADAQERAKSIHVIGGSAMDERGKLRDGIPGIL